ncbi:RagB/SusD family nutrient uptake outer membrane protein [Autumnicola musiva]|uniref:RagB/SusD family nutrient uptake outer membrane protein n=1 Tax=Autumnicola musiva TaxID=3075589 RepID=A0ABU3D8N6_9FLAO|nr:RagB/SusD family nutrient uptake outer membrane protein [Zunongwangia sp. F117]MDT0677894.1 RagB/SusD family nutrient uptake outer membrane protein [Zunongwangia sp. F117]
MNKSYLKIVTRAIVACLLFSSCEAELDLPPVDEFSPENVLQTEAGIESLLFSAYANDILPQGNVKNEILVNEITTDMSYVRIGAVERELTPFLNFNWDASDPFFQAPIWNTRYQAIRDANTVLENIENTSIEASEQQRIIAEARYLRAAQYAYLYRYFGVVPLRTTTDQEEQPQALPLPSQEEFNSFLETELLAAAENLLPPAEQAQRGRATKGHAYAVLTKFLMQTRQWQKVVDMTGELMDLNYYELYPDYRELFFVENEGNNREIIVTWSYANEAGFGNQFQNGAFPPGFLEADKIPEFTWDPSMANWATQFSIKDGFYDSFAAGDDRKQAIIETYTNRAGDMVNLRTTPDNLRSLKYFDNNQVGNFSGSDFPYIRYADILLSRAEALNRLNGPTQEAVDLVNQVRTRSIDAPYTLSEVGDRDSFNEIILQERSWEFYSEGKRREDLIRHDKFIDYARARGLNAQSHQIFFPYPQGEINTNPELTQKEGY